MSSGALTQLFNGEFYFNSIPQDDIIINEGVVYNRSPTCPSLDFVYLEKSEKDEKHSFLCHNRFNPDATISPTNYFNGIEDSFHTLTREYNKFKSINEVEKERKCASYEFTNEVDIHEKIHIIERPDNEKTLPIWFPKYGDRPDYTPLNHF